MDAKDALRAIGKHWVLFLVATVLGLAVGGLLVLRATPQYRSSVTFFVSTPTTTDASALAADQFATARVNSYVRLANSDGLIERILDNDSRITESATTLRGEISATADLNTVLLTVDVVDPNAAQSLRVARGVSRELPGYVRSVDNVGAIRLTVVSGPRTSADVIQPSRVLNLGIGLIGGLIVGLALALIRDLLDKTMSSSEALREVVDRPVLGVVPLDETAALEPLLVGAQSRSVRAEAMRQLRTNVQFTHVDHPVRLLVVTSSVAGEGKSTTAANLALMFAETGRSVLLVEADMRRPRVTDYLGLERSVGLSNVLAGQIEIDDVLQPWGEGGLVVLASGATPPNPSEMLGSDTMSKLMSELRERFDLVVVDTPPTLPVTDAAVASVHADGVIVVVRAARTTRAQVAAGIQTLEAVDARILGTVLNMAPRRRGAVGAYESYGYDAQAEADIADVESAPVLIGGDATDEEYVFVSVEGDEVEGDEVEGDEVEGDEVEGDEVEGDEVEGDEVEGDEVEGEDDQDEDVAEAESAADEVEFAPEVEPAPDGTQRGPATKRSVAAARHAQQRARSRERNRSRANKGR